MKENKLTARGLGLIVILLVIAAAGYYCLRQPLPNLNNGRVNSQSNSRSGAIGHQEPKSVSSFKAPANWEMVKTLSSDLRGDGRKEHIALYLQGGTKYPPTSLHLVADGSEKVTESLKEGYTVADLDILDLNADGKNEVLVYQCCTGSCGASLLDIYEPSPTKWKLMFAAPMLPWDQCNNDVRYKVRYLGKYRASFIDHLTGLHATIKLNPANYGGNEDLLVKLTTWVDPVCNYTFKDNDGDHIKEIIARQSVCGLWHPDILAEIYTAYKLTSGEYKPVKQTLTAPEMANKKPDILAEVAL